MKLAILKLSLLILCFNSALATTIDKAKFKGRRLDVCEQCYKQKIGLFMHCLANESTFRAEFQWCHKQDLQARYLRRIYATCDKLFKKQDKFLYRSTHVLLPYDSCDACYHNAAGLMMLCMIKRVKPHSDCAIASQCLTNLMDIYRMHPYALAENPNKEQQGGKK